MRLIYRHVNRYPERLAIPNAKPNPTNPNRPTKKLIKLKVKCDQRMTHAGREPWPFSSQEITLTAEPGGYKVKVH